MTSDKYVFLIKKKLKSVKADAACIARNDQALRENYEEYLKQFLR